MIPPKHSSLQTALFVWASLCVMCRCETLHGPSTAATSTIIMDAHQIKEGKEEKSNGDDGNDYERTSTNRHLLASIDSPSRIRHALDLWYSVPVICQGVYGHISDWDVSRITNMNNLFADAPPGFDEDLSRWNVQNVFDMSYMFANATSFGSSGKTDFSQWDVSNVLFMNNMFQGATTFNTDSMKDWNTSNVLSFAYQFANATSFNGDISNWDVFSNSYDLSHMFHNAISFNSDISNWMMRTENKNFLGTTGLTYSYEQYLDSMFQNATSFNGDLSQWQTEKVNRMESMFEDATNFNNNGNLEGLSNWNVAHVETMYRMFVGASAFRNHNLCWNVIRVVNSTSLTTVILANTTDMFLGTTSNTLDNVNHCPSLLSPVERDDDYFIKYEIDSEDIDDDDDEESSSSFFSSIFQNSDSWYFWLLAAIVVIGGLSGMAYLFLKIREHKKGPQNNIHQESQYYEKEKVNLDGGAISIPSGSAGAYYTNPV